MSSSIVDPSDTVASSLDGDPVFDLHRGGKMVVASTVPLTSREDLSLAYTPGVARVCEAIAADESLVDDYTWVSHTVAVVTDGSAVLGLGNIGPGRRCRSWRARRSCSSSSAVSTRCRSASTPRTSTRSWRW
ncbi:hypothetical protein Prubr_35700 [Polymorphospora rubra]|uniref:Malic enzyme N-terminal domain-containing protein n=1 Tax=Polymorphospora rubra TaxID=338584 RepID=A0A810N2W8_9ACTN|nr:hypothetical protein Prubr_35700 [Polymorphospora rubra]